MTKRIFAGILTLALIPLARAQTTQPRLTFDVATIRPSQPGQLNGGIKPLPGGNGYTAQNVPVKLMISLMYKVPMRQLTGGPDWLDSEHYDIEAKADRAYSLDDLHIMFQNLLADRFHLKFHKEAREGNVYALTIDKSGLKMKPDEAAPTDQNYNIPITFGSNGEAIGKRVPMQYLCWWLGDRLQSEHRPVIDKTGLTQTYDFTLQYAPDLPNDAQKQDPTLQNLPSLFDALRQQLGLTLTPQKGPVDYFIIDHAEKPSDN